jgi:serpin B
VEVDEKGTEAAAVTSVTVSVTSVGGGGPMVLRFNRPFVFAIREVTTNTIVFMGKLMEPHKSS